MPASSPLVASTAPDLQARDGLGALERAARQPLMLGLFLPIQNGGWTPSSAPRGTDWSFDYNARLVVRAEEAGFDLAFGLAQWLGADGHGGRTNYRKYSIDPLLMTSGVAALTRNIILISTVHVLYGWHPLHLAKMGATLDHMTGGRWGLNLVTGFRPNEIDMFGLAPIPHDARYLMAAEFTAMMERLWREDANVTWKGDYWSLKDAYVSPKPVHGRPIMVSASSSETGLAYAAKHSDLIFITSPGGADLDTALETLPAHTKRIRELAAAEGREVRTVINPHVICRDTEREVRDACRAIVEAEDAGAVDGLMGSQQGGDQASWRGHQRRQRIIGGNVHVFGTPEQVVEQFRRLKSAGCDGLQINFFDYAPDLDYFVDRVMPLMKQAGLRLT
jgi:alkanesulfonate monooxygenase SsuD/methylene tetrahydromethanopterin reductase-like flavin-dependent oxidoreductase (luciferase family)